MECMAGTAFVYMNLRSIGRVVVHSVRSEIRGVICMYAHVITRLYSDVKAILRVPSTLAGRSVDSAHSPPARAVVASITMTIITLP